MRKEEILEKMQALRNIVSELRSIITNNAQDSQHLEPLKQRLDEFIQKIDRSIENISKEKVHIALFGAFSDGKSSVVSSITKNFNIKIAPEPTTDKVTSYEYGNYFIVDTPGTFSHINLHDEKTRKYISEANVILFVVDAVNPIKDSHRTLLKEVLVDMGKLENTIFVLNKMDSVVMDLEDEEEYKEKAETKKRALLDMLDYLDLSYKDKEKIRVVAVSANPNGLGFEHWSKSWNEYMKLSRMENLIREIQDVCQKDREKLIYSSGVSVILDISTELEKMFALEDMKKSVNQLVELKERLEDSYNQMEEEVEQAFVLYRNRINRINQNYLLRLELCRNSKDLSDFVKNYIGTDDKLEKMEKTLSAETEDVLQILFSSIQKFYKNLEILQEFTGSKVDDEENDLEPKGEIMKSPPSFSPKEKMIHSDVIPASLSSQPYMVGSLFLSGIGSGILSLSKLEIMRGLLYFRKISGLSNFIQFTGRGTHMIWASRWASVVQGAGAVMSIVGIIGFLASVVLTAIEKEEFEKKKAELKESLDDLFSQISSLEFLLGSAGINISNIKQHFENFIGLIENEVDKQQKYYKSLEEMFTALRHIKNSIQKLT